MTGRSWRELRIDALLDAVQELGITMSRAAAGELLDERVNFVAERMRVTPATARTYLSDEALAGLARSIAFSLVAETPGAELMGAPRTAAVPVRFVGRVVAGLGEAQRILMIEREDLDHIRHRVAQISHIQCCLACSSPTRFPPSPLTTSPPSKCHRLSYCALPAPWKAPPT